MSVLRRVGYAAGAVVTGVVMVGAVVVWIGRVVWILATDWRAKDFEPMDSYE